MTSVLNRLLKTSIISQHWLVWPMNSASMKLIRKAAPIAKSSTAFRKSVTFTAMHQARFIPNLVPWAPQPVQRASITKSHTSHQQPWRTLSMMITLKWRPRSLKLGPPSKSDQQSSSSLTSLQWSSQIRAMLPLLLTTKELQRTWLAHLSKKILLKKCPQSNPVRGKSPTMDYLPTQNYCRTVRRYFYYWFAFVQLDSKSEVYCHRIRIFDC